MKQGEARFVCANSRLCAAIYKQRVVQQQQLNANWLLLKARLPGGCWLFTPPPLSSSTSSSSCSPPQEAIRDVHVKGIMYRAVEADIGMFCCSSRFCLVLSACHQQKKKKKATRTCLCCMQLVMHDCDKPIKGPALCWTANYFTRLSASCLPFPPLPSSFVFSLPFSREIHLLRRAEPRCAEEAVRARKKDVPHYQQPL